MYEVVYLEGNTEKRVIVDRLIECSLLCRYEDIVVIINTKNGEKTFPDSD